ncbi:hypothetical protein RB195_005246 [Necator americanus]|uniref:Uncharacterized protein n=1 Tax=Necator americanus TaxID=51031 RepID=A0ABR1BLX0_NECAM
MKNVKWLLPERQMDGSDLLRVRESQFDPKHILRSLLSSLSGIAKIAFPCIRLRQHEERRCLRTFYLILITSPL